MSTAELERLTEVRDELESIGAGVLFIVNVLSFALLTALFYVLLSSGVLRRFLAAADV